MKLHFYNLDVEWTGNSGNGTSAYHQYERSHTVHVKDKERILCSSDPAFRGDKNKHNPEELLLASVASCHMLWYLHLCSEKGITVIEYTDNANAVMEVNSNGSGKFTEITLNPKVLITDATLVDQANQLHYEANKLCFIANSLNFSVLHNPICEVI